MALVFNHLPPHVRKAPARQEYMQNRIFRWVQKGADGSNGMSWEDLDGGIAWIKRRI